MQTADWDQRAWERNSTRKSERKLSGINDDGNVEVGVVWRPDAYAAELGGVDWSDALRENGLLNASECSWGHKILCSSMKVKTSPRI